MSEVCTQQLHLLDLTLCSLHASVCSSFKAGGVVKLLYEVPSAAALAAGPLAAAGFSWYCYTCFLADIQNLQATVSSAQTVQQQLSTSACLPQSLPAAGYNDKQHQEAKLAQRCIQQEDPQARGRDRRKGEHIQGGVPRCLFKAAAYTVTEDCAG